MRNLLALLAPCLMTLSACSFGQKTPAPTTTFTFALGSCADQDKPQPLLDVATARQPDAFVYLGDNIYGDSHTMDTLRAKYARLGRKPEFQRLKAATRLFAVWDDHDYGWNDTGRHFPHKAASKDIFLDFWEVPADHNRRQHLGIYGTDWFEKDGRRVQLIYLDTRTFRDDLVHRQGKWKKDSRFKNDYVPNQQPDSTFLGAEQWAWLKRELQKPADARLVASSNQFSHQYNGWESWTNVPHERQRMLNLIRETKANGVIFMSGDVHWGEISRLEEGAPYPVYDLTSSGITQTWDKVEPNTNRIGGAVPQNNVGVIELRFAGKEAAATLSLFDSTGKSVERVKVDLEELTVE